MSMWSPLLAIIASICICGCASTQTSKIATPPQPDPDDEITAANWRQRMKSTDPYAGTPYEGTAATPAANSTAVAQTTETPLPSDQEPTYNPEAPIYPDPDYSQTYTAGSGRYHIVEPGDTLWKIAQEYGTTVRTIRALNGFSSNVTVIRPGDKIKLP